MKNYLQPGNTVTLTTGTGGAQSGDVFALGSLIGVVAADAGAAEDVEVQLTGVFLLPKATGAGIDLGAKVYWDAGALKCTATQASNALLGACLEDAGSSATTVKVRLNGTTI